MAISRKVQFAKFKAPQGLFHQEGNQEEEGPAYNGIG